MELYTKTHIISPVELHRGDTLVIGSERLTIVKFLNVSPNRSGGFDYTILVTPIVK